MTTPSRLDSGLRLLAGALWARLAFLVLYRLAMWLRPPMSSAELHASHHVMFAAQVLVGIVAIVGWSTLARESRRAQGLAGALAGMTAVSLLLGFVALFARTTPALADAASYASLLLDPIILLVCGRALQQLAIETGAKLAPAWSGIYYTAAVSHLAALAVFQLGIRRGMLFDVPLLIPVLSALMLVTSLVLVWLQLLAIRATRRGQSPAPGEADAALLIAAPPSNDILVGALWLVGGLVVTAVSFSIASSGSGGGRYVVTTGAIAYGLVRLVRGLGRSVSRS